MPLLLGQGLALSPEGHYAASPEVERSLRVGVQSEQGQDVYTPEAFRQKFGWKNEPNRTRLGAK